MHFFFWPCPSSQNVKWPSSQNSFKPFPFKAFSLCNKYLAFSWEAFLFKMSNYMWRANFHLETLSVRIFLLHNLEREIFSSWIAFFFFFQSGPAFRAVRNCLIQAAKAFALTLGSTLKQICKNGLFMFSEYLRISSGHFWVFTTHFYVGKLSASFLWYVVYMIKLLFPQNVSYAIWQKSCHISSLSSNTYDNISAQIRKKKKRLIRNIILVQFYNSFFYK